MGACRRVKARAKFASSNVDLLAFPAHLGMVSFVNTQETASGYALFDLDQTIVPWDTQLLFCNFVIKKNPLRSLYLLGFIPFAPFAKWLGPERMKRVFLNYLAGMSEVRLDELAREFVSRLIPSGLYSEIVDEVQRHKREGRITILNSASPDIWVRYIAEKLGFDHYYGTQVAINKRMGLFPTIIGSNNKGAVKIGRMKKHFPSDWSAGDVLANSWGYSDSHADLPMLLICQNNVMVHPTDKLKAAGEQQGWKLLTPVRPTQSKFEFGLACARQALGLYPF